MTKRRELPKTDFPKQKKKAILFDILNSFFDKRGKIIFLFILLLTAVVSLLLFDVKVSIGGDDSGYILSSYSFSHDFIFPGFQGALYPLFLSIFIHLFGIKLILLKLISLLCMLVFFGLFYSAYKKNIPSPVLFFTMLILAVNSHLLYYSSQTYSEAFFMMIQGFLFLVMKYFISDKPENINLKNDYKKFLLLGFALFLAALTKNIGYAGILAVLFYFIISKRWKSFLLTILSVAVFLLMFESVKRFFFHAQAIQLQEQGLSMLHKDYYNPSQGFETFHGYIQRLIDNLNQYISKDLFIISGLRHKATMIPILTVITSLSFFALLFFIKKKNGFLFFTGVYTGIMCLATFLILQNILGQERLIIIYFPFLLIFFLGGFYYLTTGKKWKIPGIVIIAAPVILFFCSLIETVPAINAKKKILKENVSGNILYGYDAGWTNFIKMSEWAAKNVPADEIIASRKPEISFIYTERKFYGLYQSPAISSDSLIKILDADTATVSVIVRGKDFYEKKGLDSLYNEYRTYIRAILTGDRRDNVYGTWFENIVYSFPKNRSKELVSMLIKNQVPCHNLTRFISESKAKNYDLLIYIPESLLNTLKENKVQYLILSSFTFDGTHVVNTVHRVIKFIQMKYPIFMTVYRIGDNEKESSSLIEIHYEWLKQNL